MSNRRNVKRDDFDIEPIENYSTKRKLSEKRSTSRRRSNSRYRDDNRSRSRSLERSRSRGLAYRRGRYAASYSRSRSRSHSRGRGYSERHGDVAYRSTRRHRDSRSRSYSNSRSISRSRSRSPTYYRRNRRDRDFDRDQRKRARSSKSGSRSRSSSHFRDYSKRYEDLQKSSKESETLKAINEEEKIETEDISHEILNKPEEENIEDLPLPKNEQNENEGDEIKPLYQFNDDEPIDRARIHREMEEKLRQTLAKEGKVYPPPKPEATHPVFANDGSFLELFKKMQQQKENPLNATAASTSSAVKANAINSAVPILAASSVNPATAPYLVATATGKSAPPPPMVGRRKGGKILKTGMVAKPKAQTDASGDPKDFWSLYLAEVNKYKNTACESEQGNRPLVK